MKAVIVNKPFEIHIADVEVPEISDDEVLVKIISGGICGSDISIYNGKNSLATYPRLIGHEYGGKVVKIGKNSGKIKVGDIVAVDPVRSCGHCYACLIGCNNVCSTLEVTGVHCDGGFAEYVKAPAEFVYPIDTSKIPEKYVCMVEPYSIGMQVNYRGGVKKGDKVLVMGSGPIGLCIMQVAKSRGASVMMTDLFDERLERALKMGADVVINVKKEELKSRVMEWTGNEGVQVVADTVCSQASFPEALDLACPAGSVVVLGLTDKPSEVTQAAITKKGLNVMGSSLSSRRFPEVIKGFEDGSLTPQLLNTNTVHYTDVAKAFEMIMNHPEQVCKVIIEF